MTITGKVLNWNTYEPVPGATVALVAGNVTLATVAAKNDGTFEISTNGVPDNLLISSVGYETRAFGVAEYEEFWTFFLQPSYKTEGEVTVTAVKAVGIGWIAFLVIALLIASKKRK